MRTIGQTTTVRIIVLSSVLICSLCTSAAWADVLESARMLPDDTAILVSVESVAGLRAALEKTSLCGLYKDPAIQEMLGDTEKKLREQIDKGIKDLWQKMKIENPPQQIPYPEGRVVLGISIVGPAAQTNADAADDKSPGTPMRFVVLVDVGSRAAQVAEVLRSLSAGAANTGDTVQKKDIAGIEMSIIVPNKGSEEPTICFGLKDNWLVFTLDETDRTDFTESVARRVGRSQPGSLADKTALVAAAKTLGDAQVFAFVNADAIRSLATSRAKNKAAAERMIKGLGFDNVTGVAVAARVADDKSQDLCVKTLIGVQGPKTGIPALLAASPGPLRLNDRLVTRDAVGFVYANYEMPKLYDEIARIVGQLAFTDINMIVQAAMAMTAGEGGQPPVQLRDDVLGQLAAPLFLITCETDFTAKEQPTKSFFVGAGGKFLIGTSVRDGGRLDGALGRIHQAFLPGNPKLRREMLGHAIYLLPVGQASAESDDPNGEQEIPPDEAGMALSVVGDNLVFGSVDEVEQAIRSSQKEPDNGISSDPMFRHARQFLPSQASLYSYRNDRLYAQDVWKMLKQMVGELPQLLQDLSAEAGGPPKPIVDMLKTLSESVDFNRMPDFKTVEKYWGATVSFMQSRPEGIYSEAITLKPAPQ